MIFNFIITISIVIAGLLLIHFPLLLYPYKPWTLILDEDLSSKYGTFVSGYAGSIFLLINIVLLVYIHFEQTKSEVEKAFYLFLNIHRDNVEKISNKIGQTGQNTIEQITIIIDEIMNFLRKIPEEQLSKNKKIELAYIIIFFGYNSRATNIISRNYPDIISTYIGLKSNILNYSSCSKLKNATGQFDGYQKYLSNYFRHLFQFVKFIDENKKISKSQKKILMKILRSQLSTQEQSLLLVNAISRIGKPWITNKYLEKYQLIKNIPLGYFDSFQQDEIISNINWEYLDSK